MLLGASRVRAGNDDSILLGNDAALVGGAVVSSSNDGSALWYNPAGLAHAGQNSVDVGASAFALRRYKIPSFLRADGGRGGDASFTEIVSIPSALTYVRRWGSSVVGLGLFASQVADYTLRASLSVPVGPVADGRFRLLLNDQSARYHLAGGWGRALPRGFAIGAALFGDYYDEASFGQFSFDVAAASNPLGVSVQSSYTQAKALGFHARFGVTYEPVTHVRLGLSVETPGVYFYRRGRESSVGTQTALDDQGQFGLTTSVVDESYGEAGVGLYSPLRVRFGGSTELGPTTLALEGDVQSKVSDGKLEVDRKFTWNLRAGVRWVLNETLRLGAGLFTDRGAERTDAWGAGSASFYGGTIGGQYEKVRWLASEGDGSGKKAGLTFSSTLALRYALGKGKVLGERLDESLESETRGVGITINELTVHLGSGVYF
ncbi:MAG TPA: hypothetical protein VFX59_17315 [Polyangiales bacterium]|nr:hypothetical protein [Polyangiales bacterium]